MSYFFVIHVTLRMSIIKWRFPDVTLCAQSCNVGNAVGEGQQKSYAQPDILLQYIKSEILNNKTLKDCQFLNGNGVLVVKYDQQFLKPNKSI